MKMDELQSAIYERLTGYAPVSSAVTGIYAEVPQSAQSESDADFPFITIGEASILANDTKTDNGIAALVDVHIYSRSTSPTTWKVIAGNVYNALQKYDGLNMPSVQVTNCLFQNAANFKDPDGKTRHSVSTFRVSYRFD